MHRLPAIMSIGIWPTNYRCQRFDIGNCGIVLHKEMTHAKLSVIKRFFIEIETRIKTC